MANQIQGTVYQINTTRQAEPIVMSFSTQNIIVREATIAGIPEVLSCIIYYQSPGNSPTEYYVSEFFINLFDGANAGEVALINTVTMPDQLAFAFPTQNISIVGINGGIEGANSCIQYRGNNYYVAQTEEELYAQANTNNALPYKVYTALLTQSGTSDVQYINSGLLTIGVTYELLDEPIDGWDFTNVGAPNNIPGTKFVATGTTPNNWGTQAPGNNTLGYNTGAPVATVLENTLGNVWWQYVDTGSYAVNCSESVFNSNKVYTVIQVWGDDSVTPRTGFTAVESSNILGFYLRKFDGDPTNNMFGSIEIRVYN